MRENAKKRIFELDFLRGFALLMMCLDHFIYDLSCLSDWFPRADHPFLDALVRFGTAVFFSSWRLVLHYIFATLFLLLAGVGSFLTRHPVKRMGQIGGGAIAVTLVTVCLDLFFDMGATILFGILSVMTVGAFLCWVASRLGGKWTALGLGLIIIVVGVCLQWYQSPSLYRFDFSDLPGIFVGTVRYGADWFPIFPCAGVILVGYFLGEVLYKERRSLIPALRGKTCLLCGLGRRPLLVYLLHQPLIFALLYGIIWIVVRI